MPLVEPVTSATLPFRLIASLLRSAKLFADPAIREAEFRDQGAAFRENDTRYAAFPEA